MWWWVLASPSQAKQCAVILSPYYLGMNIILGLLSLVFTWCTAHSDKQSSRYEQYYDKVPEYFTRCCLRSIVLCMEGLEGHSCHDHLTQIKAVLSNIIIHNRVFFLACLKAVTCRRSRRVKSKSKFSKEWVSVRPHAITPTCWPKCWSFGSMAYIWCGI